MLSLDNVSVTYPGGVAALKPITLDFKPGQFTVILGGSGAGKSTLLRCCNLLQKPTTGRVLVERENGVQTELRGGSALLAHRRHTAMIFQLHSLISRKSALDNVLAGRLGYYGFWGSLLPLADKDVRLALACLERVGILHKAHTRITQLSGGERQRVGVARALVQQPEIILADEPIASLDPVTARNVMSILHGICKADKLTAVVTLHQVEIAREFADRIVGFANGHLVFDGTAAQLDDAAIRKIYPDGEERFDPDQIPVGDTQVVLGCCETEMAFVEG